MQEESYTLNSQYRAVVQTPNDLNYYPIIRINVSGSTNNRINIFVYVAANIAYLPEFGYNKQCECVDMIRSALSFVFQMYPKLKGINVKDAIMPGKNWYDTHFGAKPEEKSHRGLYKSMKRLQTCVHDCVVSEAMWLIKRRRVESWPRAIIQKIGNRKTSLRLGGGCDSRGSGSVEHAKSFRRLHLTQGDLY